MPRVIAGKYKSLVLEAPKGLETRPSTDKVKEALFSILQSRTDFYDASVLELFAGSGQLSIECLSRGARFAHLVDLSVQAHQVQKKNIEKLKLQSQTKLWKADAERMLQTFIKEKMTFDFIFLDPPYAKAEEIFLKFLPYFKKLLNANGKGILIFEGPSTAQSFQTYTQAYEDALVFLKERDFSSCRLSIFETKKEE